MFSFIESSPVEGLILTITLVANVLLAIVVYTSNPKSATNRIFTLLNLFITLWLLDIFIVRIPTFFSVSLIIHRFGIAFAAVMSFLFFLLAHTVPSEHIRLNQKTFRLTLGAAVAMVFLNLSPYAFTSVVIGGGMSQPVAGLGLVPFAALSTIFSIFAVYFLVRSYLHTQDNEKKQVGWMLVGIMLMLGFTICTILIPLMFFDSTVFLTLTPLYTLVFLGLTAYAITEYQLFNIKVLLTQALIIVIDIVLFAKLFQETSANARALDGVVLLFMLVLGYFLVRSVKNEVLQRELIETQEKELEQSNVRLRELDKQKTEFLSFASHQLRTPLTAIKWSAAAILDGTYGELPGHLEDPIRTIFSQSTLMAVFINDYLNVSRIEQGKMEYRFVPVNLLQTVEDATKELRGAVADRGLTLTMEPTEDRPMVWADPDKLTQVLTNIMDNAMKYTLKGSITISLKRMQKEGKVRVIVADTGIGMDEATLHAVFSKFTRGDNAKQINSTGSGLGLFIVKTFIEAHHGTISIESDGIGRGSRFIIELPLLVQSSSTAPTPSV
jgi:signal transduction histidine kinase